MKLFKTTLAMATALGATFAAVPAAAQVNGIATSDPEAVIFNSKARIDAYEQIGQTYSSQIQQISTVRQEVNTLEKSLDTNADGQVTDAEAQAAPSVVAQIQQKEKQITDLYRPIALAQAYAIEQLIADYPNARNQVIQSKNIQMMLTPDVIQFAPESADVTKDLIDALDTRMPSVQTAVPEGWQPSQQTAQMQQRVQQILLGIAQQRAYQAAVAQQQQNAQGQAAAQPTGR